METIMLKRKLTDKEGAALQKTFLEKRHWDLLVQTDCDAYSVDGQLLFKFRKGVIPLEILQLGVDSFRASIEPTEGRGAASGSSHKRILKDGTVSKITVGNIVESGNVGYMDASAMVPYCRKTAFAREYFERFQKGIPFVQCVDKLYAELCPEHHHRQWEFAQRTNMNYVIADTAFTTVTVNRNFRTAVHKDSGDLQQGFGNLCVYRAGHFTGGYFVLPEYGVAIDLHNGDMLFVDVHRWHGNTAFEDCSSAWERISFVMYYRENMVQCAAPSQELARVKKDKGGFYRL